MENKRLESFMLNKRRFVYIDLSRLSCNDELSEVIEQAKEFLKQFKPASVYTITNVDALMYDTKTKSIVMDWLMYNSSFVIKGAVIYMDGMKKIMFSPIFKRANRNNLFYARSRQQAIEMLSEG